ncbi:MAG: type VI secretion system tube protein Hcp [Janthinobacterium lividum]
MPPTASIYLRLTDYNGKVLTADGTTIDGKNLDSNTFDVNNPQFTQVLTYSASVEQTLNIGSQSTGAGAGKITFNPFAITRYLDAMSPLLLQASASGTPYKTAEIFFVSTQNTILSKQTYKLVAVKTAAWAADGGSAVVETITFEYGGMVMTINKQNPDGKPNGVSQTGWNRIKNVLDNSLDTLIK